MSLFNFRKEADMSVLIKLMIYQLIQYQYYSTLFTINDEDLTKVMFIKIFVYKHQYILREEILAGSNFGGFGGSAQEPPESANIDLILNPPKLIPAKFDLNSHPPK